MRGLGAGLRAKGGRQEPAEACASDGHALRELASSLFGLLQYAVQAPQPGLVPVPLLGAQPPEAPALTGRSAGLRGGRGAEGGEKATTAVSNASEIASSVSSILSLFK